MTDYVPFSKLNEKEAEERKIEEYSCYNQELDLWNTTKIAELERERQVREAIKKYR